MTVDQAASSFGSYDVTCFIDKKLNKTLSSGLSFPDYEICKTGAMRPIGPGIMYESVFYFLQFIGVKDIHTIGWDIADLNGQNKHYDDRFVADGFELGVLKDLKMHLKATCLFGLASGLRVILRYPFECYKYHSHEKCNKASMRNGEADLVSSSVKFLRKWLKDNGVSLHIHGGSTWM